MTKPARTLAPKKISRDGLALVKEFEGLYLKAYQCPAWEWTIGWGHTGLHHKDGTVYPGRRITLQEAEQLLEHDMNVFGARVNRLVKVPLSQNEFDALCSFDFNTGGLGRSTLLKRLNAGAYNEVPAQLNRWTRANGVKLAGLARRRASEVRLWQGLRPFIVPA
jgi:lysozyme